MYFSFSYLWNMYRQIEINKQNKLSNHNYSYQSHFIRLSTTKTTKKKQKKAKNQSIKRKQNGKKNKIKMVTEIIVVNSLLFDIPKKGVFNTNMFAIN